MNIVFFGSSTFALPILDELAKSQYRPSLVISEPNAPVGRKQILTPTPVKQLAEKLGIPVETPEKLKDEKFLKHFADQKPDLAIVASYGKILPQVLLDIPARGFINIHPSLLPKYRGPSPIQATLLNGDAVTGVTILVVDEEVDHGGIVSSVEFRVSSEDTFLTLTEKLSKLGAKLLIETLPKYLSGEIKPVEQDHSKATFTKLITREDGHVDWNKSAEEIERMARAYEGWPGIYSLWQMANGKLLRTKILKVTILNPTVGCAENDIGRTFLTADKKLAINCKIGTLLLEELQLEGSKPQNFRDFLNGHPDFVGSRLY